MSAAIKIAKTGRRSIGRVVRRGGRVFRTVRRGAGRLARALPRGAPRRRRRARGISGVELRGFKKVARLLAAFGMAPRGVRRPMRTHPAGRITFGRR